MTLVLSPLLPLATATLLFLGAVGMAALPLGASRVGSRWGEPLAWLASLGSTGMVALWIWRGPHATDGYAIHGLEQFSALVRWSISTPWWVLIFPGCLVLAVPWVRYFSNDEEEALRRLGVLFFGAFGAVSLVASSHLTVSLTAWILVGISVPLLGMRVARGNLQTHQTVSAYLSDFFATALVLLGIGLVYAQYYSLDMPALREAIANESHSSDILLYSGTALAAVGLFSRLGIFPLQAASSARMGAGLLPFALVGNWWLLASAAGFGWVLLGESLRPTLPQWQDFLGFVGVLTLFAGSTRALIARGLPGFLAGVLCTQGGWVLLGWISLAPGMEAVTAYSVLVTALATLLLAFGAGVVERNTGKTDPAALTGFAVRYRWLAIGVGTAFFVLGGFPPSAGFMAKLLLIGKLTQGGHTTFALLGALSLPLMAVASARQALAWISSEKPEPIDAVAFEPSTVAIVAFCLAAAALWALSAVAVMV